MKLPLRFPLSLLVLAWAAGLPLLSAAQVGPPAHEHAREAQADALAARLADAAAAAERAEAAGDSTAAGRACAAAGELQRRLNTEFPRSPHASGPRAEAWEERRQTALSRPLWTRVHAARAGAAAALRDGGIAGALRIVDEAVAVLDGLAAEFPRSGLRDPQAARELDHLALSRHDLAAVHEQTAALLAPAADGAARRFSARAVPQELFALVMRRNPSRDPDPAAAAAVITWGEADEFCTRLSWMLGRAVRLPLIADRRGRPAGAGGHDEWLRPPRGLPARVAPVWRPQAQAEDGAPIDLEPRGRRLPALGFAFVIEPG